MPTKKTRTLLLSSSIVVGVLLVLVLSVYAMPDAIWTTKNDCGDETQDANHYAVGDTVWINGGDFAADSYDWTITGKPGGASCDPNDIVASGTVTVNAGCSVSYGPGDGVPTGGTCQGDTGHFCFPAYVIPDGDCGEYQVKLDTKGDNYRVGPSEVQLSKTVEDVNGGQVLDGDELLYTISYLATSRQTGVFIIDDYDESVVTFVSAANDANFTSNNGGAGGEVRWPDTGGVTLNNNAQGTLTYTVQVSATEGMTITNYACIQSDEELPVCDTTTVIVGGSPPPELNLRKSVTPTEAIAGDTVSYTIQVMVTGGTFQSLTVSDTLPAELDYLAETGNGTCDTGAPTEATTDPDVMVWDFNNPFSGTCTIEFTAQVLQGTPDGVYCNDVIAAGSPNGELVEEELLQVACVTVGTPKGAVRVCKYQDENGNGQQDAGEVLLDDWSFTFDGGDAKTTARGCTGYWQATLGEHELCETLEDGWFNSDPGGSEPYCKTVQVIQNGQEVTEYFGNYEPVTIRARKYNDENRNGNRDAEPVIGDWEICLDGHGCKLTDGTGWAVWNNLPPGTYTICETPEDGWVNTQPGVEPPCYTKELKSGADWTFLFGNYELARLRGCKYSDRDRSGSWDDGESWLSGWEICLTGGDCKTTMDDGCTEPWTVEPGSELELCEVLQEGWENTDPGDGLCKTGQLASGDNVAVKFGNYQEQMVGGATVAPREVQTLVLRLAIIALTGLLAFSAGLILWRRRATRQ